jgi:hypothetical protein
MYEKTDAGNGNIVKYLKMSNPDGASKQIKSDNSNGHALLYCLLRMVLQNESDNCTVHALHKSDYSPHSWTVLEGENPRILQKIRSPVFQCSLFTFRENGKNRFRFNPKQVSEPTETNKFC